MTISSLLLGVTHRGRALYGRVFGKVTAMASVMGLLEDERGDVVRFAVYNQIKSENPVHDLRAARQMYRPRSLLCICEPYYKLAADNIAMVRVDDPAQLVFLSEPSHQVPPSSASTADLKRQATTQFKEGRFVEAREGYKRALVATEGAALVTTVLQNLAAAFLKQKEPSSALCCAAAAMLGFVARPPTKACYRAAVALEEAGQPVAACWAVQSDEVADDKVSHDVRKLRQEVRRFRRQSRKQGLREFARAVLLAQVESARKCTAAEEAGKDVPEGLEDWKRVGNERFGGGDVEGAVCAWRSALSCADGTAAVLLGNLAQVALELEEYEVAVLHASAAVLLVPSSEKAHYRRAKAALKAGWHQEAGHSCEGSLEMLPESWPLRQLLGQCNMAKWEGMSPAADQGQDSGEKYFLTAREHQAMMSPHIADGSAGEVAASFMRMMELTNPDKVKVEEQQAGPRVPPFHEHFLASRGVPPSCDVQICHKVLSKAFGTSVMLRMLHCGTQAGGSQMHDPCLDEVSSVDKILHLPRYRSRSHRAWLGAAHRGDISFRETAYPYHAGLAQLAPFCNRPNLPLPMVGGVHVAVGFVDLGDLAESLCSFGGEGSWRPLHWIGIDSSAYACACSSVVRAMLQQECPVDHIVQV
jgi:tetratricopeptide (TPR) repeat protein